MSEEIHFTELVMCIRFKEANISLLAEVVKNEWKTNTLMLDSNLDSL